MYIPFLCPLSFLQLQIFVKKNLVVLKEFVKHNSLNKFSKYKFYIIKDLLCELHLGGIFSHLKQDFWILIFLHRAQYFLATHSQCSFWRKNVLQMYCFVHFLIQLLASLHKSHFWPHTQILHVARDWQVVYFTISHTNYTPLYGHYLLFTNIAQISFYIVLDLPITESMVTVDISYLINSLFWSMYKPSQRNNCWPSETLFIYATCNTFFA